MIEQINECLSAGAVRPGERQSVLLLNLHLMRQ